MKTLALLAALISAPALAGQWEIDASHSSIGFSVRHLMVSTVRGHFQKATGTVSIDDDDLTRSIIDVTIDAASIDTREPKRDAHLRSADFFDVAKHPTITFKSKRIEKAGGGKLRAVGDLTLHGVTRQATLLVSTPSPAIKSPWGQMVRGVSATGRINRSDFGLTYNKALEAGGVLIGDEVELQIDAELVSKPQS